MQNFDSKSQPILEISDESDNEYTYEFLIDHINPDWIRGNEFKKCPDQPAALFQPSNKPLMSFSQLHEPPAANYSINTSQLSSIDKFATSFQPAAAQGTGKSILLGPEPSAASTSNAKIHENVQKNTLKRRAHR